MQAPLSEHFKCFKRRPFSCLDAAVVCAGRSTIDHHQLMAGAVSTAHAVACLCRSSSRITPARPCLPASFLAPRHMSSAAPAASPVRDLVVVIGSTGTGKSQLAVELAQHVRERAARADPAATLRYESAEVVSADSMQVYRGLDVVTNKVTPDEMGGIPHHLIDFLTPKQQYHLLQFCSDAQSISDELRSRPRPVLPIVAGGTTYYVQHLLFPGLVVSNDMGEVDDGAGGVPKNDWKTDAALPDWVDRTVRALPDPEARLFVALREDSSGVLKRAMTVSKEQSYLKSSAGIANPAVPEGLPPAPQGIDAVVDLEPGWRDEKILWRLLHALDPAMARRWHPTDKRKVLNSLRVLMATGRRHSDWIHEEHQHRLQSAAVTSSGPSSMSAPPSEQGPDGPAVGAAPSARVLLFWVWRRPAELTESLNGRIGKMVARGLLPQIQELRAIARAEREEQRNGRAVDVFDYERGIFQSIGYKEFDPFLRYIEAHPAAAQWANEALGPLDPTSGKASHHANQSVAGTARGTEEPACQQEERGRGFSTTLEERETAQQLFEHGIRAMQVATRQYAKKQVRWIRRVLAPEIRRARAAQPSLTSKEGSASGSSSGAGLPVVDMYLLDATDASRWEADVSEPARGVLSAWLAHPSSLPSPHALPMSTDAHAILAEVLMGVSAPPAPTGRRRRSRSSAPASVAAAPLAEVQTEAFEKQGTSIERNEWTQCAVCSAVPPYKDVMQHATLGRYLLRLQERGGISHDVAARVARELARRDAEQDDTIRQLRGGNVVSPAERAEAVQDDRLSDEDLLALVPEAQRADVHVRVAEWDTHVRSRQHRAAQQFPGKDAFIRAQRIAGVAKSLARAATADPDSTDPQAQTEGTLQNRLEQLRIQRRLGAS